MNLGLITNIIKDNSYYLIQDTKTVLYSFFTSKGGLSIYFNPDSWKDSLYYFIEYNKQDYISFSLQSVYILLNDIKVNNNNLPIKKGDVLSIFLKSSLKEIQFDFICLQNNSSFSINKDIIHNNTIIFTCILL